jgi:hypothetical protein
MTDIHVEYHKSMTVNGFEIRLNCQGWEDSLCFFDPTDIPAAAQASRFVLRAAWPAHNDD